MKEESLVIRRFGPLEEVELPEIKRFNVFIGESGSGKSTIMKVLAMMRWIYKMCCVRTYFKNSGIQTPFRFRSESILSDNGLKYFVRPDSEIHYSNGSFHISLLGNRLVISNKGVVDKDQLTLQKIAYISDKRVLIPDLAAGNVGIRHNMFYLDETFLNYQKALEVIHEAEIKYLGVRMTVKKTSAGRRVVMSSGAGSDVKFDNLPVTSASSGLQSSVALHLITAYFSRHYSLVEAMNSTVVRFLAAGDNLSKFSTNFDVGSFPLRRISLHLEEPELSLFPSNQWGLMQYLVGECLDADKAVMDLTMATHSPYILTAVNIMMLAYRANKINADAFSALNLATPHLNILSVPQINPADVGAWMVSDGHCASLFDSELQLIDGTHLDATSDAYEDLILHLNDIIYG